MKKIKYELPKCDCGKDLEFIEEYVYHHTQTINKNGSLSKKINKEPHRSYCTHWLQCKDFTCNKNYEIEYDEKDRVIRGDFRD